MLVPIKSFKEFKSVHLTYEIDYDYHYQHNTRRLLKNWLTLKHPVGMAHSFHLEGNKVNFHSLCHECDIEHVYEAFL